MDRQKSFLSEQHFFGAATVGDRGQIVIPAEARKRLGIKPGDKVLVMGHPYGAGLVLFKIDAMREFLSTFIEGLEGVERTISEVADNKGRNEE